MALACARRPVSVIFEVHVLAKCPGLPHLKHNPAARFLDRSTSIALGSACCVCCGVERDACCSYRGWAGVNLGVFPREFLSLLTGFVLGLSLFEMRHCLSKADARSCHSFKSLGSGQEV